MMTMNNVIGVLGGTFNPPHCGHLRISSLARKMLGLQNIYWLVGVRNPFKSSDLVDSFKSRVEFVRYFIKKNRINFIKVCELEGKLSCSYTYKTMLLLRYKLPNAKFIWIMGSDCVVEFHRWKRWQAVMSKMNFLVFERKGSVYRALASRFATSCERVYSVHMLRDGERKWFLVRMRPTLISSSMLRC